MPSGKGSKLLRYVEHRLRVTLQDGRQIVGTFLAFDKHLNLVLSEAEEFRSSSKKQRSTLLEETLQKRSLGLVLVRGENVVSMAVEGPPPPSQSGKQMPGGPGMARGAGRGSVNVNNINNINNNMGMNSNMNMGINMPPSGLGAAPVHGVGAPPNMGGPGINMPPPPPPHNGGMGGPPPPGMGRGRPY